MEEDELRHDWRGIVGREREKDAGKHVGGGGGGKGSSEENSKNCQSVQTIPSPLLRLQSPPPLPRRPPHPYFSSPVSSSAPFCLCCLLSAA